MKQLNEATTRKDIKKTIEQSGYMFIGAVCRNVMKFAKTQAFFDEDNYAHGNLDIDFIDKSLLDLIYTERIVYAMQIKFFDVEIKNIQNVINDLFRCGLNIH